MDKDDVVHIYIMECYSALKKEGNPAICNNMDEPGSIMLSEISQTEKERFCMTSLICEIFKKKKSNL